VRHHLIDEENIKTNRRKKIVEKLVAISIKVIL